jgi:PTH1 family peptidyl-tRNA hydrolase|tara:strand:- start:8 stop:583 length:576 start_codon:yes stop_codon:yes gene_type:complete
MFLLVGLGNPGKTYANNRHNIGFMILESLEKFYNTPKFTKKFKSEYLKTNINENIVFLLKPMTYMNDSGIAVKEIKDFYNISVDNIFVFHDEIDLNPGDVRVKKGGSHNGHNGLKSIDQFIGKNYNRVRMGVSRPSKLYENNINENVSNWVLSDFTLEDKTKWLNSLINNISDNILLLINNDINNFLKNIK